MDDANGIGILNLIGVTARWDGRVYNSMTVWLEFRDRLRPEKKGDLEQEWEEVGKRMNTSLIKAMTSKNLGASLETSLG